MSLSEGRQSHGKGSHQALKPGQPPEKESSIPRRLCSRVKKKKMKTLNIVSFSSDTCQLSLVSECGLEEITEVKLLLPASPPPASYSSHSSVRVDKK